MKKRLMVALAGLLVIVAALGIQGDLSAASLTARVTVAAAGSYTNTVDLMSATAQLSMSPKAIDFANGTGLNQADKLFTDTRTIAASTTEDLDVAAGGLNDAFGAVYTIAELKALIICASASNVNNVVVGGDVNSVPFLSTAATTISVKPGGCFVYVDPSAGGTAVTAGTGDIIQVANSGAGTGVIYDVVLIGSSV